MERQNKLVMDLPVSLNLSIRVLDIFFSILGLLLSVPLMLLVAVVIRIDSKGPVCFVQERLGQNRKLFKMVKFRTMVVNAEKNGPRWASKNDNRVTRVGRILRKTRLDELPQFYNILKGDMSFVGPRPIRSFFAEKLSTLDGRYEKRFLVKPGLTGFAQIYAPYGTTVEEQMEKLEYDLSYLHGISVKDYLKIIFLTCGVLAKEKGV